MEFGLGGPTAAIDEHLKTSPSRGSRDVDGREDKWTVRRRHLTTRRIRSCGCGNFASLRHGVTRLQAKLRQARMEGQAPLDLVAALVADDLQCLRTSLLERQRKLACLRDTDSSREPSSRVQPEAEPCRPSATLVTARFAWYQENVLFVEATGPGSIPR